MRSVTRLSTLAVLIAAAITASGRAQVGRGSPNWPTVGADAQRTSWMRIEPKLSAAAMAKPIFQFLWKAKLDNQPAQLNALTQPLLLQNIISHKGFKALAFVGGSADVVYAIDYDLNRMYWKQRLNTAVRAAAASVTCPGGLTAIARAVALPQPPAGRGGPAARGPAPPNRGGINPGSLPINSAVYAVSSGGMLHFLNPHIGADIQPPIRFTPPNAKVAGLTVIDNVAYAAIQDNCGGAPNGILALDLGSGAKAIARWESGGASIAGTTGPTFGLDGTLYIATGASQSGTGTYASSVVALEPRSLKLRDSFTAESAFTTAPIAFRFRDRDLLVAGNSDGGLYLLDARSLGGSDHKTALARSAPVPGLSAHPRTALASWEEPTGTRWVLAPSGAAVVAFRIVDQNGALSFEQAWTSREIASPLPPVILNDIVFVVASGLAPADAKATAAERIKRAGSAVLYALDGRTGKELWTSGTTITSFVPGIPPSAGDSQVYVVTYDGTLYAFGLPQER